MARTQVTQDMIIEMNELYLKIGTYAGVSREMGGTPSATTVKKYIIPNYVSQENLVIEKFDGAPCEPDWSLFKCENWGEICVLSNEEKDEIKSLWKELNL